jgi:hypothetical protein
MTELPKDLITKTHTSHHYSQERSAAKAQGKNFKEWMSSKEKEEKKSSEPSSEESCGFACIAPSTSPFAGMQILSLASPVAGVSALTTEMEVLFEKMASTMLVMTSSGEQETTLFLDGAQFSSSPFFGTRITIKEFSTAPKIFNVEIASQQAALHVLAAHTGSLMAAFESNKFSFSVHRLTTQLQEDSPLLSRQRTQDEDDNDRKRDF